MSARCKPGDLAYVVGPCTTPGLVGRIVIVERIYATGEPVVPGGSPCAPDITRLLWWFRPASSGSTLPQGFASGHVYELERRPIADAVLRPIRPNEGEDESLSWSRPRVEETA